MTSFAWLASYPKSGNTWTRVMLSSYTADASLGSLEDIQTSVPNFHFLLHQGRMLHLDDNEPLVVKTHFLPGVEVQRPYADAAKKVVYLVRNPKDVIRSAMKQIGILPEHGGEFAEAFIQSRGVPQWAKINWGTWLTSVQEWSDQDNVRTYFPNAELLVLRYEDIREDPAARLTEIIDFLGFYGPADPERIQRAVEYSALENMRALEQAALQDTLEAKSGARPLVNSGLRNQSLSDLGEGLEELYAKTIEEDEEFSRLLERFGYAV
jgi:hypothetical protein